jgi:hypothetical protein
MISMMIGKRGLPARRPGYLTTSTINESTASMRSTKHSIAMRYSILAQYLFFIVLSLSMGWAQTPSGSLFGVVTDPNKSVIATAQITVTNQNTGVSRSCQTSDAGEFSISGLPAGRYLIVAEASGFGRLSRAAVVEAGTTTTLDLTLQVGPAGEAIEVSAAIPTTHRDSHEISNVVTRDQIENLPLNGRSVFELAKLEPGAQQPTPASNNRLFIPLLGSPVGQNGRATRVTIDGGSIMQVGNGGSAMGFSQEIIQEFQVSSATYDLSTGVTGSGAINVVTRSGGNQLHGAGFFFFRDHSIAAFPGLARSTSKRNPFFQRKQWGLQLGGPIRRNRTFLFGSFERSEQDGVFSTEILTSDFSKFSVVTPTPRNVNQSSLRFDTQLSARHTLFLRQSHEGVSTFSTSTVNGVARAYPSAWTQQPSWADQSIMGLMSQLSANLVNDIRFSYFFISSKETPAEVADCTGCVGIGAPSISVGPDLFIGNSNRAVLLGRRFHLNDVAAWQHGKHRIRFGGDFEVMRGGRTDTNNNPVSIVLYSPEQVRVFNDSPSTLPQMRIPLPAAFSTLDDIFQLPVLGFNIGVGDPVVPQKGFGHTRVQPLVHLFVQDTWRLHPRLVLNYGLAWTLDFPLNYDLRKPRYLEPFFGAEHLGRRDKNWNNLSPSLGIAFSPDRKTVIRGGVGVYYDFQTSFGFPDSERLALSPRGVGRGNYRSTSIRNLVDLPGLPIGTPLGVLAQRPTFFTGAVLMQLLGQIRAGLEQQRGDPNNRDFSVTNIETDKTGALLDQDFPSGRAVHVSAGLQRELGRDMNISADFVHRRFSHLPATIDRNHFFSAAGPVLPLCTATQRGDPAALCSLGPIDVFSAIGDARYHGFLLRAERRFSKSLQFLGSYAYSSNTGHVFTNGLNNNAPLANRGPLDRDVSHILNIAATAQLPKKIQLGTVVTFYSKPAFSAFLGGLDLDGDGRTGDLLPGSTVNAFNRRLGKQDLRRLVATFNNNLAGTHDALGRPIPHINLPCDFEFGDSLFTHDLRLARSFTLSEHARLTLIGEVFNTFNVSNLSGYSGDLLAAGFGQPTSRITQVFGSGGPRSLQLGARIEF